MIIFTIGSMENENGSFYLGTSHDRLESVLKQSGVQAITLHRSVGSRRRERWNDDHGYADMLITNPRLV